MHIITFRSNIRAFRHNKCKWLEHFWYFFLLWSYLTINILAVWPGVPNLSIVLIFPKSQCIFRIHFSLFFRSTQLVLESLLTVRLEIIAKWFLGLSLSWSYGSLIYNYLCNQCLSPLMLWVRNPFMARCTRFNMMW